MKRLLALAVCALVGIGSVLAEEKTRFEVSAETGHAGILSGPQGKSFSNAAFRFGFAPSKEFQLTITASKWDGELAKTDSLATDFALDINKERDRSGKDRIDFHDARLDKNDLKFEQIELGFVRTIPIAPKHWEGYVGVGIGVQKSKADFTWQGYVPPFTDPNVKPALKTEETNEFITTVRGGVRYLFLNEIGVQLNFKWIPIAKMFGRDYNGVELNLGIVSRFGKF